MIKIKDFVESRINEPEEYKPGIYRKAVTGDMVVSVTEKGYPKALPVTYVWKIKTPSFLVELVTEKNDKLILTQETKIFAGSAGKFDWIEASKLAAGDIAMIADKEKMLLKATTLKAVNKMNSNLPEFVYDLTVDQAHSFIGNGFAVHNTAAAVKDDFGDGRWTLEAGALVLADKGLACIDELDKMSEQDRSSLHEAMESQKISVAKAGITAALQCRCSMLAAANPKKGRFDDLTDIADQIDLPPTLMSRFDMMFILKDVPEKDRDAKITEHILKVHHRGQIKKRGGTNADDAAEIAPIYGKEILRKYVAYAKKNIIPVMSTEASDRISENYQQIRRTGGGKGKVPITARQLEAYIRLAEASAKARLSETVTLEDANRSIRLIHYYLDKAIGSAAGNTAGWNIDTAMSGAPTDRTRNAMQHVKDAIQAYETERGVGISKGELIGKLAGQIVESEVERLLEKLLKNGDIYNPSFDVFRLM
jgi:replicative DNA helicase Mcm